MIKLALSKEIRFFLIGIFAVVLIGIGIQIFSTSSLFFRVSSQTVIKQLQALNRLETASFTIEKVIDSGTQGNIFQQLLFGDKILLIAHGQVIAGFDLSRLLASDIEVNGKILKIVLPPPQILVTKLDNKETRVYDRTRGLLSSGDKDLESKTRLAAEKEITKSACAGNILEEAAKNARSQLSTLFKTAGFTTVVISIPNGNCE